MKTKWLIVRAWVWYILIKTRRISIIQRILFFFICLFFLSSCNTLTQNPFVKSKRIDRSAVLALTPNEVVIDNNYKFPNLLSQIQIFKQRLLNGAELTSQDWRLHDQLLEAYRYLKSISQDNKFLIPAHTKIKTRIYAHCIDPLKYPPLKNEDYSWQARQTSSSLDFKIIDFSIKHPEVRQEDIQNIILNAHNGSYLESYPDRLKGLLSQIKEEAGVELPSKLKSEIQSRAEIMLEEKLNEWGIWEPIQKIKDGVKGGYRDFENIMRERQNNTASLHAFNLMDRIGRLPSSPLFIENHTVDMSTQDVIFYNPTDTPQILDLNKYYLKPASHSVQRMALKKMIPPEYSQDVIRQLEDVLYGGMLRTGIGFTPVMGDVADIYEFLEGKDFTNGKNLTWQERVLSGVAIVAGSGVGYRYALRAAYSPSGYLKEFERGFSKLAQKAIQFSKEGLESAKNYVLKVKDAVDRINASRTLQKIFRGPKFKKSNFYLKNNGEIIPSKGYRYVNSKAPYMADLLENGMIKNTGDDIYATFDDIDNAKDARSILQLPVNTDARYKIEFDTKQIMDDIHIPKELNGSGKQYEPVTGSYPELREGNGTQVILRKDIQAKRIIDLETGEIIYETK